MNCAHSDEATPHPSRIGRRAVIAGGLALGLSPLLPGLRGAAADTRDFGFLAPQPASAVHVRPIMFPVLPDPVLGKASWSDTYLAARGGGRRHEGQDLMGKKMLKLLACVDGTIAELRHGGTGGSNSLYLKGDDGWYYCYLHINNDDPDTDNGANKLANAFAAGLKTGSRVKKGDHLAYLGDSGNAEGSGSHCHFEIRMPHAKWYNASAVNPKYSLDAAEPAKLGGGSSSTKPATGDFAPFATATAFATRQGRDFLGSAPSSQWVDDAVAAFGNVDADGFIEQLLDESAQADVVAPNIRLYLAYFLRLPDTSGLQFWIDKVRAGTGLDVVSDQFASSSEFQNRYGKLNNPDFVVRIYENVFGRTVDAGGLLFWTHKLDHGAERGWVMRQLCESSEYKRKVGADVSIVSVSLAMLGKVPTSTSTSDWAAMTRANNSALQTLIKSIRTSPAYAERVLP